jgi:ATP-dependent Lhr-like helicase
MANPQSGWRHSKWPRRAFPTRVAGRDVWLAVEDVALYRRCARHRAAARGVPAAYLATEEKPVEMLLFALGADPRPLHRSCGGRALRMVPAQVKLLLEAGAQQQRLLRGEFPIRASTARKWCDPEGNCGRSKRRTIAKLRGQVSPVPREVLGRFLPSWASCGGGRPSPRSSSTRSPSSR